MFAYASKITNDNQLLMPAWPFSFASFLYLVIEAAAENKYKKLWVVSVYNGKNNGRSVTQVLDAANAAPSSESSETLLASPVSADNSIAQNSGEGNTVQADSQALGNQLAGLDEQLRQTEGLLPGPARDAQVQAVRREIDRVTQQAQQTASR